MKYAAAIIPSLGFGALVLLAIIHVYSEFRDASAWESLSPDTSGNEGSERTKVWRTCSAETVRKKGVVIVTTLSHEKIKEFSGVDNFYEKLWRNRKAFADLHGHPAPPPIAPSFCPPFLTTPTIHY
jgi:hypothetical protein